MEPDHQGVETLEGNLANINLVDILTMITSGGMVGTLEICSSNVVKKIFFREKGVSIVSYPPNPQWRLGDMLIDMGAMTQETLEMALNEQRQNPQILLGQILLRKNYVSYADIVLVIRRQIKEELFELFQWTDAEFVFRQGMINEETRVADSRVIDLSFNSGRYVVDMAGVINTLGNLRKDGTLLIQGSDNQLDIEFRDGVLLMGTYGVDTNQSFINYLVGMELLNEADLPHLPALPTAYEQVEAYGKIPNLAEFYYEWLASLFLHVISEKPCVYKFYSTFSEEPALREPILTAPLNFRDILLHALVRIEDWSEITAHLPIAKRVLPIKSGRILDVNQIPLDHYFPLIREHLTRSVDCHSISGFAHLSLVETMVVIIHFVRDGFFGLSEEFYELAKLFEISEKEDLQRDTLLFMLEFYPWEFQIFDGLSRYYSFKNEPMKAAYYLLECSKFLYGEDRFKILQKVLSLDPNNSVAQKELIQHHLKEGRIERALPIAKKIVGSLLSENNPEEAKSIAQYFIENDHDAPMFYSLFIKEYRQREDKEKLIESLRALANYYELRSKYETLLSIYNQILEVSSSEADIKEKANNLRKQGFGGGVNRFSPRIVFTTLIFLFIAFLGYYFIFAPSKNIEIQDFATQEKTLSQIQSLKDAGKIKEARNLLKPLLSISATNPLYKRVQELVKELDENYEEMQILLREYEVAKKTKNYFQARDYLEKILAISPSMATKIEKDKEEILGYLQEIESNYRKCIAQAEEQLKQVKEGKLLRNHFLEFLKTQKETFSDYCKYNPKEKFLDEQINYINLDIQVNQKQFQENFAKAEKSFEDGDYTVALERYKAITSYVSSTNEQEQVELGIKKCEEFILKIAQQEKLWTEALKAVQEKNSEKAEFLYKTILEIFPNSKIGKQAEQKLGELSELEKEVQKYLEAFDSDVQKGDLESAWLRVKNFPPRFQKAISAKKLYFPVKIEHPSFQLDVFQNGNFLGKTPFIFKLKNIDDPLNIELILDGFEVEIKGTQSKRPWLLEFGINRSVRFSVETKSPVESQPILIENNILICTRNGLVQLLEPKNGKVLWQYSINSSGEILDSPLYANGKLYFGCTNGQMVILSVSAESYSVIFDQVISRDKFEIQPTILNNILIIPSQQGSFYAMDPQNGNKKWLKSLSDKTRIRQVSTRIVEFEKNGYFATVDGRLWKIDTSGEITPSRKLEGRVVGMVPFYGNFAVASKNFGVVAFSPAQLNYKEKTYLWQQQLTGETLGLTLAHEKLWASAEGSLFNFRRDGDTDLEVDFISCRSVAEFDQDKMFIATREGLTAYDLKGSILWRFKLASKIYQPFYWDRMVYFGCANGTFYALSTE